LAAGGEVAGGEEGRALALERVDVRHRPLKSGGKGDSTLSQWGEQRRPAEEGRGRRRVLAEHASCRESSGSSGPPRQRRDLCYSLKFIHHSSSSHAPLRGYDHKLYNSPLIVRGAHEVEE
jgi:hypothetical protein